MDVAFTFQRESAFVSGCDGVDLFALEVAQQVLLAQQAGLHAFCTGALERMHDREARLNGAVNITAVIASETMILLNITAYLALIRPHVEKGAPQRVVW